MSKRTPSLTVHINPIRPIDPLKRSRALRAARVVLRREWGGRGEVGITFDGDACLRDLNREFLGRDEPTDVIAFNLSSEDAYLIGDVYISVDRAVDQARALRIDPEEELLRLELHGLLHLVGYDHAGENDTMWRIQEGWVKRLMRKVKT